MVTFDTNVLLYASDRRDPRKQRIAAQTLRSSPDAILLWQVAAEFIASSRKLAAAGVDGALLDVVAAATLGIRLGECPENDE